MQKCLIVAIADNLAIGKDNALLWRLPEDMKFFRDTTMGHPVIMGRKTYESIGRPLPKRLNIVISRSMEAPEGVIVADSLEKAFEVAEKSGAESCFVMGGGEIYRQALPLIDKLFLTLVHTTIEDADTFFPETNPEDWEEVWCSGPKTENNLTFEFKILDGKRKL